MKTKMMIVLAMLFSLQSFGQTVGQIFASGGINYRITSATEVEVAQNLPADITGAITIPADVKYNNVIFQVTNVGDHAFEFCNLTTVSIANSVLGIGQSAFDTCSSLTSVNIPNSVLSIGIDAFYNCSRLTSVNIPNSVLNIGNRAFNYCRALTSLTIPNSVTSIGSSAFGYCINLTSITIPNSVLSIGSSAFHDCYALTAINIPNSVSRIEYEVFHNCSSLNSVTIPDSITFVSNRAFSLCSSLTTINVNWLTPLVISRNVFPNLDLCNISLNVPSGTEMLYNSAFVWNEFGGNSNLLAPIATSQTFYDAASVADLSATGQNLKWYNSATSTTVLPTATAITSGIYYVAQSVGCKESPRTAVAVTILPLYTAIPDNNFEQALFDKGIDTVLGDNRVLTAAIINIPTLDVSNKGIADLTGIEAFYALTDLNCSRNFLTSLNINTVVLLQKLNCSENQIASLNLSNQTALQLLRCEGNLLMTINTTGISTLQEVYCSNNLMTNLDLSAQTNLQKLYCNNNRLTNLNITGLTHLNQLGCNNNQLANLNVSNASLSLLNCGNNLLTNIDFKFQEPTLTIFNCQGNLLSQMDLRGYNQLSNFNCTLNPNLSCISVDDVAYATASYQKDATASFSPNCYAPIVLNYCRGVIAPPLASPFAAGVTSRWYTTAVGGRATLVNPTPSTNTDGTRVYYVSQVSNGIESARIAITVNTLGLPGTPGAITGATAQGSLVGTTIPAVYSVTDVPNATAYNWTVPAGVNIVSGQGTTTLTVNFNNVAAGAGPIGNLMVVAVNDLGCSTRVDRILALTKALPAAPTAIRMTDAALAIPTSGIPTAVTNISRYIGTNTVLTLTANPVVGVTTYEWELPTGVNVLSGAVAVRGGALGGNIITVNFEGITPSSMFSYTTTAGVLTYVLRLGVRSITGVGASTTSNASFLNPNTNSTARLLTLTATAPRASSAIRMTDAMSADPTKTINNISTFIGTSKTLTLTATPVATANDYSWELPKGVKQLSGGNSNVITVNFADVPAGTTSLYLGVKTVNGAGESVTSNASLVPPTNSTARLLRLSATVPAAVRSIDGQVDGLCGTNAYTYVISPSALATSYEIIAPKGSIVTSKGKGSNTTNVLTTADLDFTVVYPEKFTTTKESPASISVYAVNGVGKSAIARILVVTTAILRRDRLRAVPHTELSIEAKLGFVILRSESPAFNNYITDMQRVWTVNDGVEIVSGQGTDEIEIDYSKVPPTITSTKVSMYYKNSCGLVSLPITITINLEPVTTKTAETITIEATEVYPNPVVSDLSIDIIASKSGNLDFAIYSLEGIQVVNSKTFALKEGANTITENVSNLAKGIYIVQLLNTSNNELITKKLIKN